MNFIEGRLDKSDYAVYGDFINFNIDGYWLDESWMKFIPTTFAKD